MSFRQRIREHDPLKTSELLDTSILFAKYPEENDMSFWLDDEAEKTMMVSGVKQLSMARRLIDLLILMATAALFVVLVFGSSCWT